MLAAIGRSEIKRNPSQGGMGLATAALIIGPLGLVLGIVVGVAMLA